MDERDHLVELVVELGVDQGKARRRRVVADPAGRLAFITGEVGHEDRDVASREVDCPGWQRDRERAAADGAGIVDAADPRLDGGGVELGQGAGQGRGVRRGPPGGAVDEEPGRGRRDHGPRVVDHEPAGGGAEVTCEVRRRRHDRQRTLGKFGGVDRRRRDVVGGVTIAVGERREPDDRIWIDVVDRGDLDHPGAADVGAVHRRVGGELHRRR